MGVNENPPKISWQRLIRSGFEAVCGKQGVYEETVYIRYIPFLYVKNRERRSPYQSYRRSPMQHPKVIQDNHNIFLPILSMVLRKKHRKKAKNCRKDCKCNQNTKKRKVYYGKHLKRLVSWQYRL